MIRHDYTACSSCHADPSGGSLLTPYGRAQGEILLRTHYGKSNAPDDEAAEKTGSFMFGAVRLPEQLLLGADFRAAHLRTKVGGALSSGRLIIMQADLLGQLTVRRFRANAAIGYLPSGGAGSSLTIAPTDRIVSRVHWVGVDLGEDRDVLIRAGRINVPFGLRMPEHTSFVRLATRTDTNGSQQHGASISISRGPVRAEAMLIAGNFQLSPDSLRERGYSGYFEYAPIAKLAFGGSSLITNTSAAGAGGKPTFRQAHGVFARYSPNEHLSFSAEVDFLHASVKGEKSKAGLVSMAQVDGEVVQGLHLIGTLEQWSPSFDRGSAGLGDWGSVAWFFGPHFDLRVDAVFQKQVARSELVTSQLLQIHYYL